MFTLQILHASDFEAGVEAFDDAPNLAAIWTELEADAEAAGIASISISSGDNYIPSPFLNVGGDASLNGAYQAAYQFLFNEPGLTDIRALEGRLDITVLNLIGIDAATLGNHEFDLGTNFVASLLNEDVRGASVGQIRWLGTQFPYLSANLDFSGDPNLAGLFTDEILSNTAFALSPGDAISGLNPPKIAPATIIEEDGELIGVIGATTQILGSISSPGGVVGLAGDEDDMAALAAVLQPVIDEVRAGADGVLGTADDVTKIIVASHLQDLNNEIALAPLLNGVDIIIGGGSNTRLADENDRLRLDDTAEGAYPIVTAGADGTTTLIVNTDGNYSYVGRLQVTFDAEGDIDLAALDSTVNGIYATDDQGVLDVTGAATIEAAIAANPTAAQVDALLGSAGAIVQARDGTIFGQTDVFLEGRREQVRTEETNLGNLTADANIFATRAIDPTVTVSIKNGGGIRFQIGDIEPATGEFLPPQANPDAGKETGDISQLDIENSLRFNNLLSLVTLTPENLKAVLEHAVAAVAPGATPGQFAQVGGLHFSFDPEGTPRSATDPGSRVQNVTLLDDEGVPAIPLIRDGAVVEGAPEQIRVVTLNFLAAGGDGYPFPALATDRLDTGIGEQQALQQYLAAEFNVDEGDAPFAEVDTGKGQDARIQNLNFRSDTVDAPVATAAIALERIAQFDSGTGETGSEVVAHENGRFFVTNGGEDRIDVFTIEGGKIGEIDLSTLTNFGGLNSVAVRNGLVAVAVEGAPDAGQPTNGVIALYDAATLALIGTVPVGNLPDQVSFSPDGSKIIVANEGEFNTESEVESDAPGSVSIIDVATLGVTTVGFGALDGLEDGLRAEGVRIFPGNAASLDLEPEYATVLADGTIVVSLQEANSFAFIDGATGALVGVRSAGTIDHSLTGLDASDRDDAINIRTYENLVGLRMADAIAGFEVGGQSYFATANEGDDRGDAPEGDAVRIGDILDGEIDGLSIDPSVATEGLERLTVSAIDGDTDGDGDIDVLHAYGSRSFSIFDAEGNLVFDSGDDFEKIIAERAPERFNSDDTEDFEENRSDNKGPEPEAITVGKVGSQTYAFIGLERDSGIMIYDVTDPAAAVFVDYIPGLEGGDISPEIIVFIPAEASTSGRPQLAVSYEVSGTTSVYDIVQTPSVIDGTDGRDTLLGDENANILAGGADLDRLTGGGGPDVFVVDAAQPRDLVTDFEVGTDKIDVSGLGVAILEGLKFVELENGDVVVIGPDGAGLRVQGADGPLSVEDFTEDAFIFADPGDQTITGTDGDDRLVGGNGDDTISGGLGRDVLIGGEGADAFVLGAGLRDRVEDFELGIDTLDVSEWGVTQFEDLTIRGQSGAFVTVVAGANSAYIAAREGEIVAANLGAEAFLFA